MCQNVNKMSSGCLGLQKPFILHKNKICTSKAISSRMKYLSLLVRYFYYKIELTEFPYSNMMYNKHA